jgi:hypothetical protein
MVPILYQIIIIYLDIVLVKDDFRKHAIFILTEGLDVGIS